MRLTRKYATVLIDLSIDIPKQNLVPAIPKTFRFAQRLKVKSGYLNVTHVGCVSRPPFHDRLRVKIWYRTCEILQSACS